MDLSDGKGRDAQKKLVYGMLQRLRGAGYGIWFLGHTKFKNIKKDGDTEGYDTMGSNLNEDLYGNIAQDMDFIMQIKLDRKKGSDNTLTDISRSLVFNSDGYHTCGSRFGEFLPKEIPLNAELFIAAIEEAFMKAGGYTRDVLLATRTEQEKERDEKAKKFVLEDKDKKDLEIELTYLEDIIKKVPTEVSRQVMEKILANNSKDLRELAIVNRNMIKSIYNQIKAFADSQGIK